MERRWATFYTKPRWEKKIADLLTSEGLIVWLPVIKTLRQWSDRKKWVSVPLFSSYIFVFANQEEVLQVLKTPGISWQVKSGKSPLYLREDEKTTIQRLIDQGINIEEDVSSYTEGKEVTINSGPLKGLEGQVLNKEQGKIIIRVSSLEKNILVTIPAVS